MSKNSRYRMKEELRKNFNSYLNETDNDYDVSFNIILVQVGVRQATLIESYNYDSKKYKKIKRHTSSLRIKDVDTRIYKLPHNKGEQILIYNYHLVSKELVDEAEYDSEVMGTLLDFICPGQLKSDYTIEYLLTGREINNPVQFYAESCEKEHKKEVEFKFKVFKSVAEDLGLDVIYKVEKNINQMELLEAVENRDVKFLFGNKDQIANIFWNIGLKLSEHLFKSLESEKDNKKLIKYMYLSLLTIAIFVVNNPLEPFYGGSDPDRIDESNLILNKLEENLYLTFSDGKYLSKRIKKLK